MRILNYAVLLALVLGVGCGKKEPELRSEKVITPDEAANKLYVEAVKLIVEAERKAKADLGGAIADYNLALSKINDISDKYPESNLAVKLVSDELEFSGKTLEATAKRVGELEAEKAETQRLLAEQKQEKQRAIDYGKFNGGNMRQLMLALFSYLADNDEYFPPPRKMER